MCMSLAKKTTDSSQCLGTVQKAKALCRLWSKMKDPVDMDLCQPLTLIYPNIVIFQADQVPVCIIRRIHALTSKLRNACTHTNTLKGQLHKKTQGASYAGMHNLSYKSKYNN